MKRQQKYPQEVIEVCDICEAEILRFANTLEYFRTKWEGVRVKGGQISRGLFCVVPDVFLTYTIFRYDNNEVYEKNSLEIKKEYKSCTRDNVIHILVEIIGDEIQNTFQESLAREIERAYEQCINEKNFFTAEDEEMTKKRGEYIRKLQKINELKDIGDFLSVAKRMENDSFFENLYNTVKNLSIEQDDEIYYRSLHCILVSPEYELLKFYCATVCEVHTNQTDFDSTLANKLNGMLKEIDYEVFDEFIEKAQDSISMYRRKFYRVLAKVMNEKGITPSYY